MKTLPLDFILIDDERVNNVICSIIIKKNTPGANVLAFTHPETALIHINSKYALSEADNVIIFLDINMPGLSGWDVLEELNNATTVVKNHIKVFILSSSVAPEDKERAENTPLVSGFIEKPLTILRMGETLSKLSLINGLTSEIQLLN